MARRFRTGSHGLELIADPDRVLHVLDPEGGGMLLSCGAALFGLRLAVRQAGYLPVVRLLPDPAQPALLARVQLGAVAPAAAEGATLCYVDQLPALRAEIRTRLALPGAPQMIIQLGRARTAAATARRPPPELLD